MSDFPWRPMSLSEAYALAYLEGLQQRRPVLRPLTIPPDTPPADDTDQSPAGRQRATGGDSRG